MNLLPLTASAKEIRGVVKNSEFLPEGFKCPKGYLKAAARRKLIKQINKCIVLNNTFSGTNFQIDSTDEERINLLHSKATTAEIRAFIRDNECLQTSVCRVECPKGTLKVAERKKLVDRINRNMILFDKLSRVNFQIDPKYHENCAEIYCQLIVIPEIGEVEAIGQCISEYAATEYVVCVAGCKEWEWKEKVHESPKQFKNQISKECEECKKEIYCQACQDQMRINCCPECYCICYTCNKVTIKENMGVCSGCCGMDNDYDYYRCYKCCMEDPEWLYHEDCPRRYLYCPYCKEQIRENMGEEEFNNYY